MAGWVRQERARQLQQRLAARRRVRRRVVAAVMLVAWVAAPGAAFWRAAVEVGPAPGPPPTLSAAFLPRQTDNPWWIEVEVVAGAPVRNVSASLDGGAWIPLMERAWGSWAVSVHVPAGTSIRFRATGAGGEEAFSENVAWGVSQPRFPPLLFGADAASLGRLSASHARPDFATIWVGPWLFRSGWSGIEEALRRVAGSNVTAAVQFYYWGDDISPECLERGCWSAIHGVWKDVRGWDALARELLARLNATLGGREVWLMLETEFNKQSVATYEPLDELLTQKARLFRDAYPAARIVMALGNWHSASWSTWTRTANVADYLGLQALRGSTRDSWENYQDVYEQTLAGARELQDAFGKPIVIHDLALSSFPADPYEAAQADALGRFFEGASGLQSAGVVALFYRAYLDSGGSTVDNYYGEAEAHWGLADRDGDAKPAAAVWIDGVRAARAESR